MAGWLLVVEDDLDTRDLLAEVLSATGLEVVPCPDAASAELALDNHGRPNVVITNLALPDMPGPAFIAQMRARPDCEGVPVVYVSGVEPSLLDDVSDEVIKKPIDIDHLLDLVAQHCPYSDNAA
jgi:DNA-binding response OmpR family regulator